MSKLSKEEKFFDLSDYGRPIAIFIANSLKNTFVTPVHLTLIFGVCGVFAVISILQGWYWAAGFFLIWKSIFDAADGEIARIKQTPSYTGRYLDSIFDNILNFFLVIAIAYVSKTSIWQGLLAYACLQLQGTLYNYYYVIKRTNTEGGDATSKIFEIKAPIALPTDNQTIVNILFKIYRLLYGIYDQIIYKLDRKAFDIQNFPNWFMSVVSLYGLGFQLISISFMMAIGWVNYIIPFLILYTLPMFLIITYRKIFILER